MGFCFLLVIAGNETTTKLIGNALYWLWRFPDQRAALLDDAAAIAGRGRGDAALRHARPRAWPGCSPATSSSTA